MSKTRTFINRLGPGILFASMSIGTSHLVLSTKAGAQYGWIMIIPIILANVLKYPFFEFGVRYSTLTRKSLIQGYKNLGKTYLWAYALITLASTFTILAALYIVTAGLLANLLGWPNMDLNLIALLLFILISAILIVGRYHFLENSLKLIVSVLFLALLITTVLVVFKGNIEAFDGFIPPPIFDKIGVLFIIGLVGWMPTAVEASGWVSVWSIEKNKNSTENPDFKEAKKEFALGYMITAILAIFFMMIGAMTLYGSGIELSTNSVAFADQVVNMFAVHIGKWSYPIIAIAAFATMFSTCMTAHDALARVSQDVLAKMFPSQAFFPSKKAFAFFIVLLMVINLGVIFVFKGSMGNLVALATFVSFVFAPIIGWMNLRVVKSDGVEPQHHPKKGLLWLTYSGIFFLTCFALYYIWLLVTG